MISLSQRHGTTGSQSSLAAFEHTKIHSSLAKNEMCFVTDAEIFGENEPADYIYQVIKGAVRCHRMLADGRRQIAAFFLPGDIFGLDIGASYHFTAEAVVDTKLHYTRRPDLDHAGVDELRLLLEVLDMTAGYLKHAERHIVVLGRKSALERVATFLLEMDTRLDAAGRLELPMCRRDIADYLGVTLETVSRALAQLEQERIVKFEGPRLRRILIRDRGALRKHGH